MASQLNVSHVTVYNWIRSGLIKCRIIANGNRNGYEVLAKDFEHFKSLREANSQAEKSLDHDPDRAGKRWFDDYRKIFGCYPPEYSGFLKGKITMAMVRAEFERRMELAESRLRVVNQGGKV